MTHSRTINSSPNHIPKNQGPVYPFPSKPPVLGVKPQPSSSRLWLLMPMPILWILTPQSRPLPSQTASLTQDFLFSHHLIILCPHTGPTMASS